MVFFFVEVIFFANLKNYFLLPSMLPTCRFLYYLMILSSLKHISLIIRVRDSDPLGWRLAAV